MVRACGRNLPEKTAFIQGDRKATWAQMEQRAGKHAAMFNQLGLERGDVSAILSQERIEVYEHWFGCMLAGNVRVGINWRYSEREMIHLLNDCRPKLLLVDANCIEKLPALADTLKEIGCQLVGFGEGHGLDLDMETLFSGITERPEPVHYDGDEVVLYTYTSGTTGLPKCVMLTEVGVRMAILNTTLAFGISPDDIWYRPNQSSWVVLVGNSAGLASGVTMVIPDGVFSTEGFLSDIEKHKVTVALLVPTSLGRMLEEARGGAYDLSTIRLMIYGGGPVVPQLIRETMDTLQCDMLQTYGMTEATGGWISFLTPEDHRIGQRDKPELLSSAGRVGLHFEVVIRDDDNNPLETGEIGTVWLRGDCVMKGYLHMPEETAETLHSDGWMSTNDVGYLDAEGYLFLKDRKKFLIITGGVNVYASAVEAVLAEHPAVKTVAVVGVPDRDWGEAIQAVVIGEDGAALDPEHMIEFCRTRLARMEVPKRIWFVDELAMTFTGKVNKPKIKEMLVEKIAAENAG